MSGSPAIRMAHDLAQQFRHLADEDSAVRIAHHIRTFWEPRIRAELIDAVRAEGETIDPVVTRVAGLLATA